MAEAATTTGVLLVNLGTPDEPTPKAIRRYLDEFLSDPRVIEVPRLLWWCILRVILLIRPSRIAPAYQSIWLAEGSPLLVISRRQQAALQKQLGGEYLVELGMRYGKPNIATAMQRLKAAGCRKIIVLPLYPQYSATTTATAFDAISAELAQWRDLPALTFIRSYAEHPGYITALANSIREHWEAGGRGDRLLISFHGIPQRYVDNGDPYKDECVATVKALEKELAMGEADAMLCFQSRVGREPWLQPYTDEWLKSHGPSGETLDAICPGFSADCLETLEEIAVENAEIYDEAGGTALRYIPALNDRIDHIEMMADLVRNN